MINSAICQTTEGWFPSPHGFNAIMDLYGPCAVVGDKIQPPEWEAENMVQVFDLPGCPAHLYVNKKIVPMLREALRQCAAEDEYIINTIGCFNPRPKRSDPRWPSLHAFGVAIDINADDNPPARIASSADLAGRKFTMPMAWVEIFESVGFTWGGRFSSYFDPMHFQYASGY